MEHPEISSTSHWVKEPHPLQEEAHLNTSNVSTSLLPCQGVLFNLEPPIKGWPNPRKIWWSDGFGSCESTKGLVMFGGWFWKLIIFLSKNKLSWRYLPRLHVRFFRLCSQAHLLEQGHPYRGCLKWWYPQLSSFFVGFSTINHPAIGVPVPPFMETPTETDVRGPPARKKCLCKLLQSPAHNILGCQKTENRTAKIFEWITLWLCQNSYWKWPFIVDFPIEHGDFP